MSTIKKTTVPKLCLSLTKLVIYDNKKKIKQQWMAVHVAGYAKLPEQFSVGVRVVSVFCVFVPS